MIQCVHGINTSSMQFISVCQFQGLNMTIQGPTKVEEVYNHSEFGFPRVKHGDSKTLSISPQIPSTMDNEFYYFCVISIHVVIMLDISASL